MERRIFIGSLPWTTSEKDLTDLFSQYGRVVSVDLIRDKINGRSRGFGFATMDVSDAETAIVALNGSDYLGRTLVVTEAKEIEDRRRRPIGDLLEGRASLREEVALAFFKDQVKLVGLKPNGRYRFIDSQQNLHSVLWTSSHETLTLQSALEELEALVNDTNSRERDFQLFFERNPDFILNEEYKKAHPRITLVKDDGQTLIPDFVLEPVDQTSLCDLLELKLPSAPVYNLRKNRERFSTAVLEARAQLLEYSRFFNEQRHRDSIYATYGLKAWMPKMFLIIGRRGNVDPYDRRKIEHAESDLHLRTYDDVISRGRVRVGRMKKGQEPR